MILLMLGFVAFAAYQPCIESVSDCSRVQSVAELTAQKNVVSAKRGL